MTDEQARQLCPESYPDLTLLRKEVFRGRCTLRVAMITRKAFDLLPEYSSTLPTGVFIGKVWKRNMNWREAVEPDWVLGRYEKHPTDSTQCLIVWYEPYIVEAQT